MQLPPALREAIDRELEGISLRDLARASEELSRRYRAEVRDGRLHLNDELAARAYLTTRLPATFTAVSAVLKTVAEARPDFAPKSVLDAGAGPGTATWAAAQCWESLKDTLLIEASPAIRAIGKRLAGAPTLDHTKWVAGRLDVELPGVAPRDLVIIAYVLDELPEVARGPLIEQLWRSTADALVIVEPGTTDGWKRILNARDVLLRVGAYLLAPCPHAHVCPLTAPNWCHFSARVARSRLHREAKGATVPWEDEKFIYLAASRHAPAIHPPRILAPLRGSKAAVVLTLCEPNGTVTERTIAKRDGASFKAARKLKWGDTLPPENP